MENQIDKIVQDLDQGTGLTVKTSFEIFMEQVDEWKEKAYSLVVTSEDQVEEMNQAREARLTLQKIRTSADKTRAALKADSLKYAKAVQDCYNFIEKEIKPMEEHLALQEKFKEIQEKARKEKLRADRLQQVQQYSEWLDPNIDLGELNENSFELMMMGLEQKLKAKEEAERKKIEQEKAERLHQSRKMEIMPYFGFLKDYQKELNFGVMSKEDFDQMIAGAIQQKKEHDEEQARIRKEAEEQRLENERIKAENERIKAENERLKQKEEILEVEYEEVNTYAQITPSNTTNTTFIDTQTDSEKLKALLTQVRGIKVPALETDKGKLAEANIGTLFHRLENYIQAQIDLLK